MHRGTLELLRCPECRAPLTLDTDDDGDTVAEGQLACRAGHAFSIAGGIPDLVFPCSQPFVDENAETYDVLTAFIARLLRADESQVRGQVVGLLDLSRGNRVLEIGCGTGANFPALLGAVGPNGQVHAFDICPNMIGVALHKLGVHAEHVELSLANGGHLPFADGAFDAVLQIGTLNRFPDVPRALAEMTRVAKVGGKVVVGDEGLAPWLVGSEYAGILQKFGNLFVGEPPLAALPPVAREVQLRWLMGDAYYVVDFRVGDSPPVLNLDATLPGRTVTVRNVLEASREDRPVRE